MTRLTWTIAWHEYVTNVRRPGFIFATLLIPALGLIGLIIATFFSGQALDFLRTEFVPQGRKPVGVVDQSTLYTPIGDDFVKRFRAYPNEAAARAALLAEEIDAYLVIPADYVAGGELTAYNRSGGNSFQDIIALDRDELNPFLVNGLVADKVDAATLARVSDTGAGDFAPIALDAQGNPTTTEETNPFAFIGGLFASMAVSILLFVSIFSSSNYLLRSVSEEKENRVMEVVLSSVSATDLLWGKVIGLGALGLTQVGVWLLSGVALTGSLGAIVAGALAVLNPLTFVLALVYFILGYLLYGVLMAAAGSLGTSVRESQQIGSLFSFGAVIPWMINGFVMTNPNMTLARVLSWFPLSAPTMMMLRLPYGDVPAIDIVGSIAVLVLSLPLVLWAGVKVFRTSLLIYGKRLSLKEIWSALRKA
jgi:ABC-2 type transport system permease protein